MNKTEVNSAQLFETVAYGDALGLPVETLSASEIANKHGWLDRLLPDSEHAFFQDIFQQGMWSDDTQLTLAVAKGLMEAREFDLEAQARVHIAAYEEVPKMRHKGQDYPRGWGGSTTKSVQRLMDGVSPYDAGAEDGSGNGVLMKMSPLAAWALCNTGDDIYRHVEALTIMTHNTDEAIAASQVHMDVLRSLPGIDTEAPIAELLDAINDSLHTHEPEYPEGIGIMRNALGYLFSHTPKKGSDVLECTDGKGFYAPQTLAMAYGAFLCNQTYPDSVYTAVNLGGDTDSIGSIAGTMSLFLMGTVDFPEEADLLQERAMLKDFGQEFHKFVVGEAE